MVAERQAAYEDSFGLFFRQAGRSPSRARIRQRMRSSPATTTSPTARPIQMPTPASGVQKPREIAAPDPASQYPHPAMTNGKRVPLKPGSPPPPTASAPQRGAAGKRGQE